MILHPLSMFFTIWDSLATFKFVHGYILIYHLSLFRCRPSIPILWITTFLENWGIKRRLSSAYNLRSNGRVKLAVKSAKSILSDNVDSSGRLNLDKVARALLIHRNIPVADLNFSPVVMLYGHTLFILILYSINIYTVKTQFVK